MKKRFTIILLMFSIWTGTVIAQTRKVAILETVDRQNQVTYGVKLMLRGYLAEAVTNTAGYEAYDRTDLNKILDEQEFQRTGYVSDEEIKKIGQMTGVQYILVAETGKMDEENLFITAKILNVETARVEMTTNVISKIDVISLQQGAKDLAARLLKVVGETTLIISNAGSVQPIASAGHIKKINANEYTIGGQWVDRKGYYKFLQDNRLVCVPAYNEFQKGHKLTIAGWSTFGAGGCLALTGSIILGCLGNKWGGSFGNEALGISGLVFLGVGTIAIISSIPLLSVGYSKKHNAYNKYNEYCAPEVNKQYFTLNLQSSQNGLGLALQF